jgi:hypothetical protein
MRDYLRLSLQTPTEDSVIEALLESLHGHMESVVGQKFEASAAFTDEPYNGLGKPWIWIDRPIATLSAVKIGPKLSAPWEVLDVSNPEVVAVDPRFPRRLVRTQGQAFIGETQSPARQSVFPLGVRNVWVSYTSADNLPVAAKMALRDAVAYCYRRLGQDEASQVSVGGVASTTLWSELDKVPLWKAYVDDKGARGVAV